MRKNTTIENQKEKIQLHLQYQLLKFCDAWLKFHGWKDVLEDKDSDDLYSERDVFRLREKCKFLYFGVQSLLESYEQNTILQCFDSALDIVYEFKTLDFIDDDNVDSPHPKTLSKWYSTYNRHSHFPSCHKLNGHKIILPTLLTQNPDVKEAVMLYCNENLGTLSSELLHEYLFSTCLPSLLKRRQIETNNMSMTMKELLKENNLLTLHLRTVGRWLISLGFKYCTQKKLLQ